MAKGTDGDMEAALYHEHCAASLGVLEAVETLAHLYLNMNRNLFQNYHIQVGGGHYVALFYMTWN